MKGEHILHHQSTGIGDRVDILLRAYIYMCLAFFVVATALAVGIAMAGFYPVAATLFVLATAATGYGYSTVL